MPESYYDKHFPKLKSLGFRQTSPPDYYNCIAFAVGDLQRFWWPGEYPPKSRDYWPSGVSNAATLEAFSKAFATVGFARCSDGKMEVGFEKIAPYALDSEIQHAAKQMEDGSWRSKLGPDEDIEHPLEGLEGPCYGKVIAYFKRPKDRKSSPTRSGCLFGWLRVLIE